MGNQLIRLLSDWPLQHMLWFPPSSQRHLSLFVDLGRYIITRYENVQLCPFHMWINLSQRKMLYQSTPQTYVARNNESHNGKANGRYLMDLKTSSPFSHINICPLDENPPPIHPRVQRPADCCSISASL